MRKKSLFFLCLLFCFLFIFPKGGFKVGEVPITWGYLLLFLTVCVLLICKKFCIHKPHFYAFLSFFPFQLLSGFSILANGSNSVGYTIAFFVGFFFLPFAFFVVFSERIQKIPIEFFFKMVRVGIFFIASYGIFLFFYKLITKSFFEIPFLTINFHDWGELEKKCIQRDQLFKLISTYNNGNLYGVCLLMWIPLYQLIEKSFFRKGLVFFSLFLTLSRTVWIGLLCYEIFSFFTEKKSRKFCILRMSFWILLFLGFIFFVDGSLQFLWDPSLGGRSGQLEVLQHSQLFSQKPFSGIFEIVYLGILDSFGILGLLSFLLAMVFPIVLRIFMKRSLEEVDKRILLGMVLYLVLSGSDGALLLIPTLCFYWFLASFLLKNSSFLKTETEHVKQEQVS